MPDAARAVQTARDLGQEVQRTVPVRIVLKFGQDRGANQAVLIAWNFLQSLIPIVLIVLAVGGFALRAVGMDPQSIQHLVFTFIPTGNDSQVALAKAISGVQKHSGVFAILALLSFLWSASSLFGSLEQVMADAYKIKTRNFVVQKLVAFGLMILFCLLIAIGVGSTTLTAFVRNLEIPGIPEWIQHGATGPGLTAVIGVVSGMVLYFVLFWVVPNARLNPLHVLPGVAFSGIGFYVLTLVFPLYLDLNKGINRYGSEFAFLFTLLFFFYFLGLITVLGIEINTVLFPLPKPAETETETEAEAAQVSRRVPKRVFGLVGAVLTLALALFTGSVRSAQQGRHSRTVR